MCILQGEKSAREEGVAASKQAFAKASSMLVKVEAVEAATQTERREQLPAVPQVMD